MLIGISAHCVKLTQDIPGPALPDSTQRTLYSALCFLLAPQGPETMQVAENRSKRKVQPRKKREGIVFSETKSNGQKEVAAGLLYLCLGWERS